MSSNDCCAGFEQNEVTVERTPNPVFRPLDDCGDKGQYKSVEGEEYKVGMPVKFGEDPNTVVPAPDGVDAIGLSLASFVATAEQEPVTAWRTGHVYWREIAPALDMSVTSEAEWWAIHTELAKANIYVEFK